MLRASSRALVFGRRSPTSGLPSWWFSGTASRHSDAPGAPERGNEAPPSAQHPANQQTLPPPVMAAAPHVNTHWLDRHLPGLRLWLDDRNRHWWIKGLVEGRCKQYHQLHGREGEVRQAIESAYQAALFAHQAAAVDERAETHLQVACLVLATHKALLPYLRDEQEVLQIIREHMGGRTAALLRFLLRATKFMQRDGYAALAARLRGLRLDMGAGFETDLQLGEEESSLVITRCMYHEIFSGEGQAQLAACCCCSQDMLWLEQEYRGVQAGRTAAISAGDPHCCFTVRRVPGAG